MSDVTSATGFLSGVMEMAGQGLDVLDPLRNAFSSLDPQMFSGDERRVFEGAALLLGERRLPTPFNIGKAAKIAPIVPARIKKAGEGMFADLHSSVQAVLTEHGQAVLVKGLSSALEQARKGELDLARELALATAEEALLGDSGALLTDYLDWDVNTPPQPRQIQLTMPQLNEDLGGGLAAGGSLCMSMVAAPSGVGKTTFVVQQVPHWLLNQGHWVLYGTGEMTASYIYGQVTRIYARISDAQFNMRLPRYRRLLEQANQKIREAVTQGRFTAFDQGFDPERVRKLARIKARELAEAKAQGLAPEHACLIVVVDNWDNLFQDYDFGDQREDQAYRREMLRFWRQASEYGYHHMNLVQVSGDAEDLKAPAGASQMQGSRKLNAYTSHQIVLYRPRDMAAVERAMQEPSPPDWAFPAYAVRKHRGGGYGGVRPCRTDALVGDWYDANVMPAF